MKISIVIPVYKDTDALPELLERLFMSMTLCGHAAELILVDDGSINDTWNRLVELKRLHHTRQITLLRLARNCGQHAATICGLLHCSAPVAVTLDADLQHPPEEIQPLLEELASRHLDLVYGTASKGHPLPRRASSMAFKAFTQPLFPGIAITSSFRALRISLTCGLEQELWRPYLSLDAYLRGKTDRMRSIRVRHAARRHGRSTYTWKVLATTAFKELYYSGRSGTVYVLLGALATLLGGIGLLQETSLAITNWPTSPAIHGLAVSGGVALISFGQHLKCVGHQATHRPLFELRETVK